MRCWRMEQLLDFIQGRADTEVADAIRAHVDSGCSRCRANLDWLSKIVQLTATDDSVDPPEWVFHRAVRLFHELGPKRKPGMIERLVAALAFDSWASLQPAVVRQSGAAPRQCLYRAEQWELDLQFEPGEIPDTIDLTGQILKAGGTGREAAHRPVRLVREDAVVAEAVTDELGEFTMDQLAPGLYNLCVELPEQEIWIERLEVKLSNE